MSKDLYIECYSGISGDMTVASLLDLGADEKVLLDALKNLNIDGFKIEIGRTKKCGIDACDFDVILDEKHGHIHQHIHSHDHSQEHNHDHTDEHSHSDSHEHIHDHKHRNIMDIYEIIDNSGITVRAKSIAKKIFDIVAVAESKAHGVEVDKVHFHEVGAIDSIVDIVAAAVCIDNLNIENVYVSELFEGTGHVRCQHGMMPVPVPAVINIISDQSLPIRITDIKGELVTPTGAASVAALKTKNRLPEVFTVKKIGVGAGKKDFEKANILRTYLIETNTSKHLKENAVDSTEENPDIPDFQKRDIQTESLV